MGTQQPVFITGGSGFVGGAVLRRLVAQGREVRALARSDDAEARVRANGAIPIRGDLFDPESLLGGMRGCASVFNVAGVNVTCVRDAEPMMRANVEGAAHVVRTAAAAGVTRVVHTSSAATLGETRGSLGRESSPHRGSFLSHYERSKFLAERRVLALGTELRIQVVCVNPSSVQGPGRTEGSARLLLDLINRRRPPVVATGISVVDVDDCATGHLLAESRGEPGQRYVLNGASIELIDAVALLRRVCGRPTHVVKVPRAGVRVLGTLGGIAARLSDREVPICPEVARTLLHGHRYDGSRAGRELGLTYRPLEETVRRTLAWYAEEGLIAPLRPGDGAD